MRALDLFPPTLEAARARVATVLPADYARTRNHLLGAVTRLSPYITHGFVSLPEVLRAVANNHPVGVQHKLVFELGWREYFHHVWAHRGDGIFRSIHAGPAADSVYSRELPQDIREARTGIAAIDRAVRTLYADGYLHNHARMWLASYVVHVRKVHWRTGADWMVAHLLDGDLASNHLSWQWVAGTGSRKPYLFNAENVARFAPANWHSPGSAIDTSYEALDALARSPDALSSATAGDGIDEPALGSLPPHARAPRAAEVAGRDVWLVHPWCLADPPPDLPSGTLCVAWWPAEHHAAWRWSAARWAFVGGRVARMADLQWHGSREQARLALASAKSVQTRADPHIDSLLPPGIRRRPLPRLFAPVDTLCTSFSAWWNRATRGNHQVSELPGFAAPIHPIEEGQAS